MATAVEALGNAGDANKGRWARMTQNGIDLYRAPTGLEREAARRILDQRPPLPPEFTLPTEIENGIYRSPDQAIGRNGEGATGTVSRTTLYRVET
jgi:hypothetical protein